MTWIPDCASLYAPIVNRRHGARGNNLGFFTQKGYDYDGERKDT